MRHATIPAGPRAGGRLALAALLLASSLAAAAPAAAGPEAPPPWLSAEEAEVIAELNRARTDPASYAEEAIRPLAALFRGTLMTYPGETPIRTNEGVRAVEECYRVLRAAPPVPPLAPSEALSRAAADQVGWQGPRGEVGHAGPGGNSPFDRMRRHDPGLDAMGENIGYGPGQARRIVVDLLIDDGVPSRGHRENILRDGFTLVGVSIGPHRVYRHMCVIDFGAGR